MTAPAVPAAMTPVAEVVAGGVHSDGFIGDRLSCADGGLGSVCTGRNLSQSAMMPLHAVIFSLVALSMCYPICTFVNIG